MTGRSEVLDCVATPQSLSSFSGLQDYTMLPLWLIFDPSYPNNVIKLVCQRRLNWVSSMHGAAAGVQGIDMLEHFSSVGQLGSSTQEPPVNYFLVMLHLVFVALLLII